jgi:hypothetical protein
MHLLKQRKTAWAITILVVLAASLLGAWTSLGKLRTETADMFVKGVTRDDPGIQHDLDWLMELAHNLTVVGGRYLDEADPQLQAVRKAREQLSAAASPAAKYDAADRLVAASAALILSLGQRELEARDSQYNQSIKADMESRWLIIARNEYNDKAAKFNELLEQFPANVLGKLVGVQPLELFAP